MSAGTQFIVVTHNEDDGDGGGALRSHDAGTGRLETCVGTLDEPGGAQAATKRGRNPACRPISSHSLWPLCSLLKPCFTLRRNRINTEGTEFTEQKFSA